MLTNHYYLLINIGKVLFNTRLILIQHAKIDKIYCGFRVLYLCASNAGAECEGDGPCC